MTNNYEQSSTTIAAARRAYIALVEENETAWMNYKTAEGEYSKGYYLGLCQSAAAKVIGAAAVLDAVKASFE